MKINKITAEELMHDHLDPHDFLKKGAYEAAVQLMIEFAKIKVTEALIVASENYLLELNESETGRLEWVIDKQSIIEAGKEYIKNEVK